MIVIVGYFEFFVVLGKFYALTRPIKALLRTRNAGKSHVINCVRNHCFYFMFRNKRHNNYFLVNTVTRKALPRTQRENA